MPTATRPRKTSQATTNCSCRTTRPSRLKLWLHPPKLRTAPPLNRSCTPLNGFLSKLRFFAIRSTVILSELRWIFLLLLSDVPVGTAVCTERKWRSLRPASWCRSPQPGKYRRILLLPSAKPPEAVRHRAHRLRRLFLCKPYSAALRLLSHFQLRTSGRSTPLSRIY